MGTADAACRVPRSFRQVRLEKDPATEHPVVPPFAVFHSHNARLSVANQAERAFDVAGSKLVFSMGERTGNIWMAEFKP